MTAAILLLLCTPGQYVRVTVAQPVVCGPFGCAPILNTCTPRCCRQSFAPANEIGTNLTLFPLVPAWFWYQPLTPYQQTVNNMRAARAERPRPRPTESEWNDMRSLESLVEQAKRDMKEAAWEDKPAARQSYYGLREELDEHRLQLSKDIHRRSRNGTTY